MPKQKPPTDLEFEAPWSDAVKPLLALRRRVGAAGLVQAFIAVMGMDGTRVLVRLSQGTRRKR